MVYLGGAYPQSVNIKLLKKSGLSVVLFDMNPNAYSQIFCDEFYNIGVENWPDILRILESGADRYEIVSVYGIADYAFESVAKINERFRIPGISVTGAKYFTNKIITKEKLQSAGLSVPKLFWSGRQIDEGSLESLAKKIGGHPVVVKNSIQNNSKGVTIIETPNFTNLKIAIKSALDYSGEALIEEFIPGELGNVDGLVLEGDYYPVSTTTRKQCKNIPTLTQAMIQPSEWPHLNAKLHDFATSAAGALNYVNGPITLDYIVSDNEKIYCLEVSPHFHSIQSDLLRGNGEPLTAYVKARCGDTRMIKNYVLREGFKPANCFLLQKFISGYGKVKRVIGEAFLRNHANVLDSYFYIKKGNILPKNKSLSLLALVWVSFETLEDKNTLLEDVLINLSVEF